MPRGQTLMSASPRWTIGFADHQSWLSVAVFAAAIAHLAVGINAAFHRIAPLRTSIQLQACLGPIQPDELPAPEIICTFPVPVESHGRPNGDIPWWHSRIEEDFLSLKRPMGPELVLPGL